MNALTPIHPSAATLIARAIAEPDLFADLSDNRNPATWALGVLQPAYDGWCDATGHEYGIVTAVLPDAIRDAAVMEIITLGWDALNRRDDAEPPDLSPENIEAMRNDYNRRVA
jgi:hypothetical protein